MAQANRPARLLSRVFDGGVVEDRGEDPTGAILLSVHALGGSWDFRVLWANEGWPRDVAALFERLPQGDLPVDMLVTARSFSSGSRKLLAERAANWADEQGSARLRGRGLLVLRDAERDTPIAPDFSWSPSALAVAEALLSRPWPEGVGTSELASLIDWSPPQVSQVLQSFDRRDWTVKFGPQRGPNARRELHDTADLLDSWSAAIAGSERDVRLTHRVIRSPLDFLHSELREILDQEVRWASSGWAAAQELAPVTDTVPSLQIYVHEDDFAKPLDQALRELGLADVAEGGRVAFLPAHPSVLSLSQPGAFGRIVSTPRVYADLLSFGGRGVDAAAHLREELIEQPPPTAGEERPPVGLREWELECRDRLDKLVRAKGAEAAYQHGAWSASYRLIGLGDAPTARELSGLLREVVGRETGWPAWWAPQAGEERPRIVDGAIECWLSGMLASDPWEADYWRADPGGRLCLIRPHEEDSAYEVEPGSALDLTVPIWRTGECLRHAERLARRLDAKRIQFMVRWTGLHGRRLATLLPSRRRLSGEYICAEPELTTFVDASAEEMRDELAAFVRRLVDPLYACFDFFEPPEGLYEAELDQLTSRGDGD
jgi:hypothetical protein